MVVCAPGKRSGRFREGRGSTTFTEKPRLNANRTTGTASMPAPKTTSSKGGRLTSRKTRAFPEA